MVEEEDDDLLLILKLLNIKYIDSNYIPEKEVEEKLNKINRCIRMALGDLLFEQGEFNDPSRKQIGQENKGMSEGKALSKEDQRLEFQRGKEYDLTEEELLSEIESNYVLRGEPLIRQLQKELNEEERIERQGNGEAGEEIRKAQKERILQEKIKKALETADEVDLYGDLGIGGDWETEEDEIIGFSSEDEDFSDTESEGISDEELESIINEIDEMDLNS